MAVEQVALVDRFRQVMRRCRAARQRERSPCWPDELSIMMVAPASRRRVADAAARPRSRPSPACSRRAGRARRGGPAALASGARAQRGAPLSTTVGRICQRISRSCKIRRLTALSSTTSTRRSVEVERRQFGARVAMPSRAVKWNVLPSAGCALDPDPAAHQLRRASTRSPAPDRCRRIGASSSRRPA